MATTASDCRLPVYGGRRARARTWYFHMKGRLGYLRQFSRTDFSRVTRLVFVCKGNICRSPYAEARARQLGLRAASCGLECPTGDDANAAAIGNALKRGLDLRLHRTARAAGLSLTPADLLVAMEPAHARCLEAIATACGAQLTLAGVWSRPYRPYIHDPFGLDDRCFQACFTLLDSAVSGLRDQLLRAQGDTPYRGHPGTRTGSAAR
ncbi:MAG: hypothetical protein WDA11_02510 [Thiohalomonadaceae bacterium]